MKMTIFDAHSAGIPTEKPKGTIELIQVGEDHSIARILKTNSPIEPFRIGDIVYSPAWSPDEPMQVRPHRQDRRQPRQHGRSRRSQAHDRERRRNRRIRPPAAGAGRETGKLTPRIAWYVVDDREPLRDLYQARAPTPRSPRPRAFLRRKGEMVKEARHNGTRPLDIGRLLSYLGYDINASIVGKAEGINKAAMERLTRPKPKSDAQKAADAARLGQEFENMASAGNPGRSRFAGQTLPNAPRDAVARGVRVSNRTSRRAAGFSFSAARNRGRPWRRSARAR